MKTKTKRLKNRYPARRSARLVPVLVVAALLIGGSTAATAWLWWQPRAGSDNQPPAALSAMAAQGKIAFDANCASCHGFNALGTQKGPPFIHDIYNPGHHSDMAFLLAAKRGVRRHHWPFGDMPPQPQVSDQELAAIVRYVRELQEANGITYRPHTM